MFLRRLPILFLGASSALGQSDTAPPVRVFLFAGQSNMVGADTRPEVVDDYPPFVGSTQPQEDVRYAYSVGRSASEGWTHLQVVDDDFGPELTFARRVKSHLDGPIAILKCAVGGTTIAKDWHPDSPPEGQQLFRRMITLARQNLDTLRREGIAYQVEALFWHQGENDMLSRELNPLYEEGLIRFIARVRAELELPDLRVFVGEVSDKGIWGMDFRRPMRELRAQQRRVIEADPHMWWVPTSHLAFEVMGSGQPHYHFGTQGQLQHGEAYAEAYLNVVEASGPDAPAAKPVEPERGSRVRVFLLAGQRNMEGEDSFVEQLPAEWRDPRSEVLLRCSLGGGAYESTDWEALRPVGQLGNFGPELSFGQAVDEFSDAPVAILKFTDSAAQISDWAPGSEDASRPRYERLLSFVREALADLETRGLRPALEAVFWHHGENETWYAPFRARYPELLQGLISSLRRDLGEPDLTWIVAEQSTRAPWGEERIAEMNASLSVLAKADPHVKLVATSDLPHGRIHFGTEGTLRLGERLAQAWWNSGPKTEQDKARYEAFLQAPRSVRGGRVEAHWLEDGSSLWYRAGARAMFVDPAEGAPRKATREDRARERETPSPMRGGRLHAPGSASFASLVNGVLTIGGDDRPAPVQLGDAEEDVYWTLDPGAWSPDGSMLYSLRRDGRGVHHLPVIDYLKAVETVETSPYLKTGGAFPLNDLAIFRIPEGERIEVDLGSEGDVYVFPIGWREDGSELLFLRMNREASRLDLMAADPASGKSRVILTDTQETFVGGLDFITGGWSEYFKPIEGVDRFLWISDRDGWRHVYQYDYEGTLISRVTEGEYPVQRVIGVDRGRDRVFLMANAESRLYDTHLYRAPLGGGELVRLTDGIGEHQVQLSPSKLFFVDTHSSLESPPVSELRDVEGKRICDLDKADVSALDELGWSPGEPFVVQAADGETDLYGVLFKPRDFDPSHRYPVIDFIYTGPFITMVPNVYAPRSAYPTRAHAMAQMGFITFIVDPRGTVERSKAFQDASYGRIGEIEIPDHVATLHQLAAERPYMDLDRVGIYGHSWGGYFALRGMLTAPDVFHVGIAGAPGELTEAAPINEPYMRTPQNNPEGYAAGLNAPLASQLQGKLLIIHGTADINAPFSTSMRMVDALINAQKPFDLLVIPGGRHSFQGAQLQYETNRIITYFQEHLQGESGD